MRNSPWLHQRRSESAPPAERTKEPPTITQQEQDEMVNRISRPTESARYRQSLFWKLDGYMDKGFHSWSKMELFEDCKQCMWTPDGTIKDSCKIRPLNVARVLPPLGRYRDGLASSADNNNNSGRTVVGSSNSGSVCMTSRPQIMMSRCESRKAVLRPRPSFERSRTGGFRSQPVRSSASAATASFSSSHPHAHARLHSNNNAARSFLMRHYGNTTHSKHGGALAVPRMSVNDSSATTASGVAAN